MNATSLIRLGVKHTRGHLAERFLARTGVDFTKPLTFNANVEAHCNIRCRYCACWRHETYPAEMSLEEWQEILSSIKNLVGTYPISFTGGEPLLKPGILDLLQWCRQHGICAGITTNGALLSDKTVKQLVAAEPWNINISVDAANAEVNDYLRGRPGLFQQICANIRRLKRASRAAGVSFPIMIKPTVNVKNFRYLVELVEWAEQIGATAIYLQPMDRWTPETYDELWIEESDMSDFIEVCEELVRLKRQGAAILNQESTIRLMVNHFREEKTGIRCRCSMQNFSIEANGDVKISSCSPVVGNLRRNTAREIWYGPQASKFRADPERCQCLNVNTSATNKTLVDKVKMGLRLLPTRPERFPRDE